MGAAELEILAPLIIGVVFILTVGGVVLLRPLSRRLGDLLELMAQQKQQPQVGKGLESTRELLEATVDRLAALEDRLDFTERLLSDPGRRESAETGRGEEPPSETAS
jgi:hypothetical protein